MTAFAGPAALAELVRAREVTPRELVELYLRRIEALDPRLNAFRVTLAEQALSEADELHGDRLAGPLAGVPVAVKDDIAFAGQVATKGSRVNADGPPASADAEPLRRLRAAGAIPIGITNVPELMIFPWTATAAYGITRNPWDPIADARRLVGGFGRGGRGRAGRRRRPRPTAAARSGSRRPAAAWSG